MIPFMGMTSSKSNLGDALFSKTQRQVLGLLFGHPERRYYANEIVRFAGVGIGSVQRELTKLTDAGLLTVEWEGRQKYYCANRDAPVFDELHQLVMKTFGFADLLREGLAPVQARISIAFVYGSVARGTDTAASDVDLMVVTDTLSYPDVMAAVGPTEKRLGRTINPTLYTREEFARKWQADNAFLRRVLEQEKIFLIGDTDDLAGLGKPR